jgi:Cyclin, N-terminal domain/Cyclin, C-terminal domain
MDNQAEIKWSMRTVLMDWVIQVHHRFNLLPETLFLTVNYIDRFLSCKVVSLGKLQLVGATAIFIAAKYEEINCPSVQEIVYMVDGGYTIDEILKAERFMLSMLQFELGWPGPMSFLRRISKADDYDLETRTVAKYFLEVTIMDEQFIASPPSFTAAAAHCLARLMLRKGRWVRDYPFFFIDLTVGDTCMTDPHHYRHPNTCAIPTTPIASSSGFCLASSSVANSLESITPRFSRSMPTSATNECRSLSKARWREDLCSPPHPKSRCRHMHHNISILQHGAICNKTC